MTPVKLMIASPFDGLPDTAMVSWAYAWPLAKILQDPAVKMLKPAHMAYPADVCRARSRAVFQFLQTDYTHLLFWDTDNAPPEEAGRLIRRLVDTGHDWVGCPYPRKRLHTDRGEAMASQGLPFGAHSLDYAFRVYGPDGSTAKREVVNGCIEVDRLGLGFTLITRVCLEKMWEHYKGFPEFRAVELIAEEWQSRMLAADDKGAQLRQLIAELQQATVDDYERQKGFTDVVEGEHHPGCALFDTMLMSPVPFNGTSVREWLSEDYAGCERFRRIGGTPYMFVGEGSPIDHIGGFRYRGHRDGLIYGR